MTSFLGKLFGKKEKVEGPESMVEEILGQVIELGGFQLSYDIKGFHFVKILD